MTRIILRMMSVTFAFLALGLLAPIASAQSTQSQNDLSAFAGHWLINLDKTRMGRFGPNGKNLVRTPTHTFIFTADGKNLQQNIYAEYPKPKPDRSMPVIADGKHHPCDDPKSCLSTGGFSKDQSFVYHLIDSHLLLRIFYVKDKIDEYSTYAISSDGKTFTLITWSPETPYWQNIQVLDKQP